MLTKKGYPQTVFVHLSDPEVYHQSSTRSDSYTEELLSQCILRLSWLTHLDRMIKVEIKHALEPVRKPRTESG